MSIKTAPTFFVFYFFFSTLLAAIFQPGFAAEDTVPFPHLASNSPRQLAVKIINEDELRSWKRRNSRRLMIGSTAPTCTYNECRGCKYKCKAEQIPVDGNDPINSAYHYKCVCHR